MAKSINLLPVENEVIHQQSRRKSQIQKISIAALLLMFFLTSLILTLRFLQSRSLEQVNVASKEKENKISGLREKESTLVLLKDRLTLISKLAANSSKQKTIYDLVISKIPPAVIVSNVDLEPSGTITISATAENTTSLSNLIADLSTKDIFKEISGVTVDGVSRGKDGFYRTTIRLVAKPK